MGVAISIETLRSGGPMKSFAAFMLAMAVSVPSAAAVRYFHWDKPHGGNRRNVTALDLSAAKVLWEVNPSHSTNFVQEVVEGVLTGNDEGEVVLLDKANGKVIWRCRLEPKAEIKTIAADTEDGFLVASGDSAFWLVSREGKLVLRCHDACRSPTPPAR
jgi:outer membrane protein assembly factor BamB